MLKFLKDLISPKRCYWCWSEWYFLCEDCFDEIEKHYYFDEMCYVCKWFSRNFEVHEECKNNVFYDKVIIMSHYKIKVIKKLIKYFKFYGRKDIVYDFGEYISNKIIKNMKDELSKYKKDDFIVVFPPMNLFRKLKRWYNHSEVLAKIISLNLWFNYEKNIILRNRQTRQQSKLNKQERLHNLDEAFKINKKKKDIIDNKIIILVDDVVSTWTTVNELSKILKEHNPLKIVIVTIASWF